MSSNVNSDVFKTPKPAESMNGMPGMSPGNPKNVDDGVVDYSQYKCRIFRGNIGDQESLTDLQMAQDILTKGLNGNGEIIIIDRATQAFESNYWIIITYLEKSPLHEGNED